MTALTLLSWLLAAPVALLLAIFSLELFVGLWPGRKSRAEAGTGDVAILIPAHDEAQGIEATLLDLKRSAPKGTRILVVADNCTDGTAAHARQAGAEVVERNDPGARGKSYALAFGRDHLARAAAGPPDVVLVLDADCRMIPGSVEELARSALVRNAPAQAINLIAADLAAAPMVQISSFAMLVKNLYRSRGMQRLGGAALLTGTGMAFPWTLFEKAELATGSIVEDLALGIEMTKNGHPPRLVAAAGVRSAPADMRDALQQRTRWEHGFLDNLRRRALPGLLAGLRRASLPEILLGLHLLVPPLALLLMVAGACLAVTAGLALLGAAPGAVITLAGLLTLVLGLVFCAWIAGGRPYLAGGALLRAPFYVLWKLPVYLGFVRKPETQWNRTPRRDS